MISIEEARELLFASAAKAAKKKCWDSLVTVANAVVALRQFESAQKHFAWSVSIVEDRILNIDTMDTNTNPGVIVTTRLVGNSWVTEPGTPFTKALWKKKTRTSKRVKRNANKKIK